MSMHVNVRLALDSVGSLAGAGAFLSPFCWPKCPLWLKGEHGSWYNALGLAPTITTTTTTDSLKPIPC